MNLKSTAFLYEETRTHVIGSQLPVETHQSFPIPALNQGRPTMIFLYSVSRINVGVGLMLLAPNRRIEVDPRTGDRGELTEFSPKANNIPHEPMQMLGYLNKARPPQPPEKVVADRKALLARFDDVLPYYYASRSDLPPENRQRARELVRLLDEATEDVLAPYYDLLGKHFKGWLKSVAAPP